MPEHIVAWQNQNLWTSEEIKNGNCTHSRKVSGNAGGAFKLTDINCKSYHCKTRLENISYGTIYFQEMYPETWGFDNEDVTFTFSNLKQLKGNILCGNSTMIDLEKHVLLVGALLIILYLLLILLIIVINLNILLKFAHLREVVNIKIKNLTLITILYMGVFNHLT